MLSWSGEFGTRDVRSWQQRARYAKSALRRTNAFSSVPPRTQSDKGAPFPVVSYQRVRFGGSLRVGTIAPFCAQPTPGGAACQYPKTAIQSGHHGKATRLHSASRRRRRRATRRSATRSCTGTAARSRAADCANCTARSYRRDHVEQARLASSPERRVNNLLSPSSSRNSPIGADAPWSISGAPHRPSRTNVLH